MIELYDNTTSLQDRTVATGIVSADLVRQFGAGGYVGRASGRNFDVRKALAYPPYDQLDFAVPVLNEGDVNARVWLRIREVEQSLALIDQILQRLPAGPIAVPIATAVAATAGNRSEGLGLAEGFRGDVLVWVRLDGDRVARCHLRDPSWFQWPLLEAAIEGNIVADFPLCNKSFNCSYSGHDLRLHAPNAVRRPHAQPADRSAAARRRRGACGTGGAASIARRGGVSAAVWRSARSMPARATAASWKSMRSIMRSTTSSVSAYASSRRRDTPMCSW